VTFCRRDFGTFLSSVVVHAALLVMLLSAGRYHAPVPLALDFVVLEQGSSRRLDLTAPRKTPSANPPDSRGQTVPTAAANPPAADTRAEASRPLGPSPVVVGQSDLRELPMGRAPQNSHEAYLAHLRHLIAHQQVYPVVSRRMGEEGVVVVRLTLNRAGQLTHMELAEPSPFRRLNEAAMHAASSAGPFGVFPDDVTFQTWQITIPIRFTLQAG
jgi:protein TonB